MSQSNSDVFFTVVIPTRNRPTLFKLALDSVLAQTFKSFEVVVVNDGSSDDYLTEYKALEKQYGTNVHWRYQIKRPNGHGQSYSMNTGAYVGKGQYLCFLDDDDYWIDHEHLQRAYNSITHANKPVDAYYTNQAAYFSDGKKQQQNVWIEDLTQKCETFTKDAYGAVAVDAEFLLTSNGFAHLNCSIIRRELYLAIKGMDENIRYECDRDIYIRTIDAANHILYCPKVIAKHHIPDPAKKDNMSTLINSFEKYLYQITVYEKAILLAKKECIKQHSQQGLSYIFKHICQGLISSKNHKLATVYAKKALSLNFTVKWWLYCQYLSFMALFKDN
jgi:glycosyltransferase involved in cell wall biosynthesis